MENIWPLTEGMELVSLSREHMISYSHIVTTVQIDYLKNLQLCTRLPSKWSNF